MAYKPEEIATMLINAIPNDTPKSEVASGAALFVAGLIAQFGFDHTIHNAIKNITPEILEKNGFHFGNTASEEDFCNSVGCSLPEEGWCYDEGAGEIKIIFPNESDGGLLRIDDQSADRHLELIFCNPLMVHQLQQALRLCGIDKEIVV